MEKVDKKPANRCVEDVRRRFLGGLPREHGLLKSRAPMLLKNLISSLPTGHPAHGYDRRYSASFFMVVDYFLSLDDLLGFNEKFDCFRAFEIDPNRSDKEQTDKEIAWASLCTEFDAYYVVGRCLGLGIHGFEQLSPRRQRGRNQKCDFCAKQGDATLYFEVKRKSGEERNSLPVGDKEAYLDQAREFTPDRSEDIMSWLNGAGRTSSTSGQRMVPMVAAALEKGADYLICMVPMWEPLESVATQCFKNLYRTSRAPQSFVSGDSSIENLRGVILMAGHDNFCLINSANPGGI